MDNDSKALEKLARNVDKLANGGFRIYCRYFMLGICYGLGSTVGVALVLVLIGYALRSLGGLPFVGSWINGLSQNLQNSNINLY
jgi:hypothetical protein